MTYIEAFFYYWAVVGSVFVILWLICFLILLIIGSIRHREKLNVFERGEFFVSILKHKILKIFTLFYLAAFSIFYFKELNEYMGSNRAYPQAKMYKIVADVSMFYFDFFIANRNLYFKPSGLKYIESYERWQNYLMQKGFAYIPEDDAERAIWKYEYYYANYVRAMTAPIDFDSLDKHDLKMLIEIGGYTTKYKPIAKDMEKEAGRLLDALMNQSMKDKYYDEVNRYATLVLFTTWWEQNKLFCYSLGAKNPSALNRAELSNDLDKLNHNKDYRTRVKELVYFLNIAKKQAMDNKEFKFFLQQHKYIFSELMALRVRFMADQVDFYLLDEKFSCEIETLRKYLDYKKEFLKYIVNNPKYKKMNRGERILIESFFHNDVEDYLLKRYCAISEDYLTIGPKILDMKEWIIKKNKIIQRIENER